MIVFPAKLDSYIIDTTPMLVFSYEKQNWDLIKTEKRWEGFAWLGAKVTQSV